MLIEHSTITTPSSLFDETVLRHLRCAHIRARLILNRIDFAGVSLRQGWVDGQGALDLVAEANLLDFVLSGVSS